MSNLPANIQNMATALVQSSVAAGAAGGGELYMQFTKFGEWVFGTDKTEPEEGSVWAVNPMQFQHGFIAWDQANTSQGPTGEVMVNAGHPLPAEAELPDVAGKWSKAIAMTLRCTNGEDEGLQCVWKGNSLGARKAYAALLQPVAERISKGKADFVPLVELGADSYTHKTYGKIFAPELIIVGWTTMDGVPTETPEEAEAPEEAEEAPRRRRRKA